jgi:hypothetical protein
MEPLDLSVRAPRQPRAELGGIIFLPRSIDKLRASLPGGNLGLYTIDGFTTMLFAELGIELEAISAVVATATDDATVLAFVQRHTTAEAIQRWNTFISAREPRGGNRAEALEVYPWLHERPDLRLAVDVLAEDDRRLFA